MFAWRNVRPINESYGYNGDISINTSNYTEEGGLLQAFEESYADMSKIDAMYANYNNACVKIYAEAYHNTNSHEKAEEAVAKFDRQITREGFFSDVKNGLINLLKKIKEKILAFFKAARQYLDSWLLSESKFAEKYEDQVGEKTLTNFKYEMYDYNLNAIDFKKEWKTASKAGKAAAGDVNLGASGSLLENYNLPNNLDWINGFKVLMEAEASTNGPNQLKKDELDDETDYYILNVKTKEVKVLKGARAKKSGGIIKVYATEAEANEAKAKLVARGGGGTSTDTVASITEAQKKVIRKAVYSAIAGEDVDTDKSSKFEEAIKKKLRGGKKEKREIHPDMDKVISGLKEHKDILSDVDDAREAAIDGIDTLIDTLKDKDYTDAQKKKEQVQDKNVVAIFQICKNAYTTLFNIYKDIVKERGSAYRSCMLAALRYHDDDDED